MGCRTAESFDYRLESAPASRVPEAQAAYYDEDGFGSKALNPAGADPTPAAAAKLGLKKYENA